MESETDLLSIHPPPLEQLIPFEWLPQQPEKPVLKTIQDLKRKETTIERVRRVTSARALLVNYALIQHDFPFLNEGNLTARFPHLLEISPAARMSEIHTIIDNWLVDNTAFVSLAQAGQNEVNSPIPLGEETTLAFRPPEYGRALVFSLAENRKAQGLYPIRRGLLDVKGVGVGPGEKPTSADHSNGLLQLGVALMEVLHQQLIELVFRHAGGPFDTLPNYGVIDLGFDIIFKEGPPIPAGLLVRRAHVRQWHAGGFPDSPLEEEYMMEIELLLRKYGITSICNGTTYSLWEADGEVYYINHLQRKLIKTTPGFAAKLRKLFRISQQPIIIQGANVQLTRDLNTTYPKTTLVDFTHYSIVESFHNTVYSPQNNDLFYVGKYIYTPDHPQYQQVDPMLRIPSEWTDDPGCIWGFPSHRMTKKIRSLCYALAEDFAADKLSREEVSKYLGTYFKLITQHLQLPNRLI